MALRGGTALTLVFFVYVPLAIIALYAFNSSRIQAWPIDGFTLDWFERALHTSGRARRALGLDQGGLPGDARRGCAWTLASLAVSRYHFFGRETISFFIILPIALPGIVTGMALNATFNTVGLSLGLLTIVIGHATFCIVLIYNNAVARLRRVSEHLEEASADLGADSWQTFPLRHVPAASVGALRARSWRSRFRSTR